MKKLIKEFVLIHGKMLSDNPCLKCDRVYGNSGCKSYSPKTACKLWWNWNDNDSKLWIEFCIEHKFGKYKNVSYFGIKDKEFLLNIIGKRFKQELENVLELRKALQTIANADEDSIQFAKSLISN